ncbi:hypothetical protein KUM39_12950 [Streptomyces sp. J2-1]|uniref:tubulin-like doman-containing protein n=1 Tax=Streptomyces corallincola TaxID=2851888 RepID=UPI001C382E4A|nr:tubulin-like doman-containing protein [Streptomyces corallincola]MBV2355268.1 hypothetical protein [Streptomyces corallincola]
MKIFQPMLFVGLGGTGGLIGAELERRLRAELCGPDGTALTSNGRLPYELPGCLQFVYADYSEAELGRLPHLSADTALRQAYSRTSRATHDLLPADFDSSQEVTRMLRAMLRDEVSGWLPPHDSTEPRINPLRNGAGQLPTVGRAALFATLAGGPAPVLTPLHRAIDAIAGSGGELQEVGGDRINGCDVFVAFSVAGGTGAGIFLDYLHLIGQAFKDKKFRGARIYPLVVMPSAFPEAKGGGREAELNAARAVVDLSRLVDEQNAPRAEAALGDTAQYGALRIRYPQTHPVSLRPGTVPTAFLFSQTAAIRPEDLRRSIVSLVVSLVGTDLNLGEVGGGGRDDDYQTFASNFVNGDISRRTRSATGIGRKGISTSLVASMTAPLDELAELVAARMLAHAVTGLTDPAALVPHETAPLVKEMFTASGLGELWRREPLEVSEPDPLPLGSHHIETALRDRLEQLRQLLGDLERQVTHRMPTLVEGFSPRAAAEQLLLKTDLFTLGRVVSGVPGDSGAVARLGFLGMLDNRRQDPAAPAGMDIQPPPVPRIKGRMVGPRLRWTDDEVAGVLEEQDRWYRWRARTVWHRAWSEHEPRWRQAANQLRNDVHAVGDAFRKHVDDEPRAHAAQVKELYDDRAGVSYLLPPQGNLGRFYQALMERLAESHQLGPNGDEAALLHRLVDAELRRSAFAAGRLSPDAAVSEVKAAFKHRVQRLFSERPDGRQARALLPRMSTLLAAEAGDTEAAQQVSTRALEQFRYKLAGMLPAAFTPEGNGRLKVLITYPGARRVTVDEYLEKHLRLPQDSQRTIEFRAVDTDSISVVLFRSEMSLTDVPEARKVLRRWAGARASRGTEDVLRWRQRLGYRDEWLASTPDDRTHILHRLLCALWNGQIDYLGDPASPEQLRIRLHDDAEPDAPSIELTLTGGQYGLSSWASLLRAYEDWALLQEENIVQSFCKVVMNTLPRGLGSSGSEPSELYLKLVHEVAPRQLRLLDEQERRYGPRVAHRTRRLREFWGEALPDALDLPFPEGEDGALRNLRELEAGMREGRDIEGGLWDGGEERRAPSDRDRRQRPADRPRPAPVDGGGPGEPYGAGPHRADGWDVPAHGRTGSGGGRGGVPPARSGPVPGTGVPVTRHGDDGHREADWPAAAPHDERTRHWPDGPYPAAGGAVDRTRPDGDRTAPPEPGRVRPVPSAPLAGRPVVQQAPAGRPVTGPVPARAPEYPPFQRAAEPDPGWPSAGPAAPWGISDTDGDADWPDDETTSGGDGDDRESWEKHA